MRINTDTYVWSHFYFKDTYCKCVYTEGELEREREREEERHHCLSGGEKMKVLPTKSPLHSNVEKKEN